MITLRTSIDLADPFGRDIVEFVLPTGEVRDPLQVPEYRVDHGGLLKRAPFRLLVGILTNALNDEQRRVWLKADLLLRPTWWKRIEWETGERLKWSDTREDARRVEETLHDIYRRLNLGETLKGSPPRKGSPPFANYGGD